MTLAVETVSKLYMASEQLHDYTPEVTEIDGNCPINRFQHCCKGQESDTEITETGGDTI